MQFRRLTTGKLEIRSCPGEWCNGCVAVVITGGAGSIKLPPQLAV